jgi:putative transposase
MKPKRYTDEQIAFVLRQAESGTAVAAICRKLGVSEPTFYRWKKHFAGMGTVEIRRLKQLDGKRLLPTGLASGEWRGPDDARGPT